MTDDDEPMMVVEASGSRVEVHDEVTAEAALPLIEGVLEYYLNNPDVGKSERKRRSWPAHDAECDKCGYEWEYQGRDAKRTTCPDCKKNVTFDERLPGRPDSV